MLEIGLRSISQAVVNENDTALILGSGDLKVLATPRLIALMENAAMNAVSNFIKKSETTVGGQIDVIHKKPTPIGESIEAMAVLTKIEGNKLTFSIIAKDSDSIIGEGVHVRYVVDREKFMNKL